MPEEVEVIHLYWVPSSHLGQLLRPGIGSESAIGSGLVYQLEHFLGKVRLINWGGVAGGGIAFPPWFKPQHAMVASVRIAHEWR